MNKLNNQKVEIRRLPYTRMLKSEMADYAEKIINIVESHNSKSAIINPLLGVLLAKEPEIAMLRLSYGVDTERLRANKLKGMMKLTISSFKLNVRMLSFSNQAFEMQVVQNAINSHLRYLNKCRNDKELNQKIAGFLDLMQSNKHFAATVKEFNLTEDINKIKRAHNLFNEVSDNRVNLLAKRPIISTQNILKDLFYTIDNLFKGIEVAHLVNSISVTNGDGSEDLAPLINELKQLSDMYYKSYAIRKANNKRKSNKEMQDDFDLIDSVESNESVANMDSPTKEITTTLSSNEKYYPSQVYQTSIKQLDIPSGKTSTINLNGDSTIETKATSNRDFLLEIGRPSSS